MAHPVIFGRFYAWRGGLWMLWLTLALTTAVLFGEAPPPQNITPIGEARIDANGDHVPDRLGESVTVAGRASVGTGVLHRERLEAFIQDDTGGIQLFGYRFGELFEAGDRVVVTGVIDQHRGQTQLTDMKYEVDRRRPEIPQPVEVTISQAHSEEYEGRLVRVRGRITNKRRNRGGEYLVINDPGRSDDVVMVFVSDFHVPTVSFDTCSLGDYVDVTGVLGQFDFTEPYSEYYQIRPRSPEDIRPIGFTGVFYRRALIIGTVVFLSAVLWVVALQMQVRRRTRQLSETEQQLVSIFDSIDEAVYVSDPHTYEVLFANQALRDRFGDVIGEKCHQAFQALETPCGFCTNDRIFGENAGKTYIWEFRNKRNQRWYHCIDRAIRWPDGRMARCELAIDITDRKRLEEEFAQSQKMEAIGRLAGGIAHDFNNLLTAVSGYSQLLLGRLRDEGIRNDVNEIKKAADRAAALTRQLLAFSRRQILQPKVLDLNAEVVEMEKMLPRVFGEDIELVTALDPDLKCVKADPTQIEQVIINLALNARDAMPRGGRLTVRTENVDLDEEFARTHPPTEPGPYVMLAVSDSGCGMDEETLSHVFEPFFTTKPVGQGTGLGLSTVYGIVKQSGGYIWASSEPDEGTTFGVYLPPVSDVAEAPESETLPAEVSPGKETILLAEDEDAVLNLVSRVLRQGGYTVLEAASAEEALGVYERTDDEVHLLLTDVVLPGIDGHELAQRLIPEQPDMEVLYMSGYTRIAIMRRGAIGPETHFIQRPFSPDALVQKVREVLDAAASVHRNG